MLQQIYGVLRAVVPALLAWAVARGWLPQAFVDTVGNLILDAVVAIVTVIAAIWSFYKNRPSAMIERVSQMPGVDRVVVSDPLLISGDKVVTK